MHPLQSCKCLHHFLPQIDINLGTRLNSRYDIVHYVQTHHHVFVHLLGGLDHLHNLYRIHHYMNLYHLKHMLMDKHVQVVSIALLLILRLQQLQLLTYLSKICDHNMSTMIEGHVIILEDYSNRYIVIFLITIIGNINGYPWQIYCFLI